MARKLCVSRQTNHTGFRHSFAAMIRVSVTTLKVSTVQQIESKRSFGVTQAALALEDGTFFLGEAFGHRGTVTGELFQYIDDGYQEFLLTQAIEDRFSP